MQLHRAIPAPYAPALPGLPALERAPLVRVPPAPRVVLFVAAGLLLGILTLPIAALLLKVSPQMILTHLSKPVVLVALQVSLFTSLLSTAVALLLGTPLAYVLARHSFRGKHVLEWLVSVPMVLPPAVAGLALLMAFGRHGLFAGAFAGVDLSFSTIAVIIAQLFVAAPLYVRSAQSGFNQVDRNLEGISATLGVGPFRTFWRVTLPLAVPALITGATMAWARALGEFGATMMFAGNFPGRSQTMPLAVYTAMQSDLDAALVLSVIMLILCFAIIATVHCVTRGGRERRGGQRLSSGCNSG